MHFLCKISYFLFSVIFQELMMLQWVLTKVLNLFISVILFKELTYTLAALFESLVICYRYFLTSTFYVSEYKLCLFKVKKKQLSLSSMILRFFDPTVKKIIDELANSNRSDCICCWSALSICNCYTCIRCTQCATCFNKNSFDWTQLSCWCASLSNFKKRHNLWLLPVI